jgi:hypothetical protein
VPDETFTKIAVGLLTNVRDLVDWGVEGGHTTEEQLRLTVSARQAKAKELTKPVEDGGAGLSQRQAAKVLGVAKDTVRRDVAEDAPKSGAKSATKPPPKPKPPEGDPEEERKQQRWAATRTLIDGFFSSIGPGQERGPKGNDRANMIAINPRTSRCAG